NREYLWGVNTQYSTDVIDPTSQVVADSATWNWVIYKSHFTVGDVVTISYANPLQIGQDTFTFSTKAMAYSKNTAKDEVKLINVFPNPYYGYQYREGSRDQHYVTFSHLPQNAVIRIFDLSGVLVRTITHRSSTPNSQFDTWNLQNDSGYPVASGIYIVYIDMPDLGTTKILKLALIQEQQILKVY
ncbi:MAG TPA: T9SS type A sorting domain-containing protein, partial [Ignavibacteriaceae bacterium]|nr:T9SS type A sorting domain-containing protein [Ignavibacteriaceae bacterium]